MNIEQFDDYGKMSGRAADIVLNEIKKKKDLLMCASTGSSPAGLYQKLADYYNNQSEVFKSLRVLMLDEWGGMPPDNPVSCHSYLRKHILNPLKITEDRYIGFKTNAENTQKECERIQKIIEINEPIDLCILGLGRNGHIGFNEPASCLQPYCHVATLSEESKMHDMVGSLTHKPEYGMTLGMQNILSSKRVILLIYGDGKEDATATLLSKKVTTQSPVTFLWLHSKVDCLIVK